MPDTIEVKVCSLVGREYNRIRPGHVLSVTLPEDKSAKTLAHIADLIEEQIPYKIVRAWGHQVQLRSDDAFLEHGEDTIFGYYTTVQVSIPVISLSAQSSLADY
jgi:hypothetical protein